MSNKSMAEYEQEARNNLYVDTRTANLKCEPYLYINFDADTVNKKIIVRLDDVEYYIDIKRTKELLEKLSYRKVENK